jgi:hypothetical protein
MRRSLGILTGCAAVWLIAAPSAKFDAMTKCRRRKLADSCGQKRTASLRLDKVASTLGAHTHKVLRPKRGSSLDCAAQPAPALWLK